MPRTLAAAVISVVLGLLTQVGALMLGEQQKADRERIERLEAGQREIKAMLLERPPPRE